MAITGSLTLFGYIYLYDTHVRISNIIISLLWLQWFVPPYALSLNYPSWTISSELLFYAIFPLLINMYMRLSFQKIGFIVLWIYTVSQLFFFFQLFSPQNFREIMNTATGHHFIYYFPLFHLASFMIGMFTARVYLDSIKTFWKFYEKYFLICFITLSCIILLVHENILIHNWFLSPISWCIIFLLARIKQQHQWGMMIRFWVLLWEASYALYIFQVPVDIYLKWILSSLDIYDISYYFPLYIIILVSISIISYRFIENPLRKFFSRKVIQ